MFRLTFDNFIKSTIKGDLQYVKNYIQKCIKKEKIENLNRISSTSSSQRGTALGLACTHGYKDIVRQLLAVEEVDVNADYEGTPLIRAIWNNHPEIVRMLLGVRDIDVNLIDEHQRTALTEAAYFGHVEIVGILLATEGVNVNAESLRDTPLMAASLKGHAAIVGMLLDAEGIKINANCRKKTALMCAAEKGHIDIVRLLLNADGIDAEAYDFYEFQDGRRIKYTAETLAASKGHESIVQILQDFISAKKDQDTSQNLTFKKRLKKINYEGLIPNHLKDPISLAIMNDPITVSSGITYDRNSLRKYFARQEGNPSTLPCPITRKMIHISELDFSTSITIKNFLEEFVETEEKKHNSAIKGTTPQQRKSQKEEVLSTKPQQTTSQKEEVLSTKITFLESLQGEFEDAFQNSDESEFEASSQSDEGRSESQSDEETHNYFRGYSPAYRKS